MHKAYIFDVFGTVVDWRTGVANIAGDWFAKKSIDYDRFRFADQWRAKYQPAMQRIRSGNRGYVPLDTLHLENLDELLHELGLSDHFSYTERAQLNRAWEQLPAWPDSVAGLLELKEKAIIAPCSNGSISLMTRLAKFANLPWDCILGAEIAQSYKPHPQAYQKSVSALGLEPEEVVMVAAHNDDLIAAAKCGLVTAFISRPTEYGTDQTTDLNPVKEYDFVVQNFAELAIRD